MLRVIGEEVPRASYYVLDVDQYSSWRGTVKKMNLAEIFQQIRVGRGMRSWYRVLTREENRDMTYALNKY